MCAHDGISFFLLLSSAREHHCGSQNVTNVNDSKHSLTSYSWRWNQPACFVVWTYVSLRSDRCELAGEKQLILIAIKSTLWNILGFQIPLQNILASLLSFRCYAVLVFHEIWQMSLIIRMLGLHNFLRFGSTLAFCSLNWFKSGKR